MLDASAAMVPAELWSTAPDGNKIEFSEKVISDTTTSDFIGDWTFTNTMTAAEENWLEENVPDLFKQWKDFTIEYEKLETMTTDFGKAAEKAWPGPDGISPTGDWDPADFEVAGQKVAIPGRPGDLVLMKRTIEKEIDVVVRKAENTMKDIFSSPYLLPGMYGAMVPSVIPLGGGINPFPMPPPFMSTVPGMIYIALLLIDAIEEKMHDDQESKLSTNPPNCIEQL